MKRSKNKSKQEQPHSDIADGDFLKVHRSSKHVGYVGRARGQRLACVGQSANRSGNVGQTAAGHVAGSALLPHFRGDLKVKVNF